VVQFFVFHGFDLRGIHRAASVPNGNEIRDLNSFQRFGEEEKKSLIDERGEILRTTEKSPYSAHPTIKQLSEAAHFLS
jgi:hypothetical protein